MRQGDDPVSAIVRPSLEPTGRPNHEGILQIAHGNRYLGPEIPYLEYKSRVSSTGDCPHGWYRDRQRRARGNHDIGPQSPSKLGGRKSEVNEGDDASRYAHGVVVSHGNPMNVDPVNDLMARAQTACGSGVGCDDMNVVTARRERSCKVI
ncbi:hypothetical protein FRIGORI9N_280006 [Frigoribacterium sp. 9N]|nr:hypothetical protein FRIGORI9N_280006 [Frigoribacterium sp. 9N]